MANNKQQQQQQQQTQKKTEVKKSNTDEDSSNAMASNSSTQAAPSDVYEFVSTPKHSSCSSGDENPIKSFDKSSLDDKSGTDSDTQMTSSAANATATSSCAQQQKRTLGDQQDRNEDNLSPAEEDSKRKKRKDSEFPLSSSQAGTNTNAKPSLISGTNRVTSRVGIKPPGPASKTMGLINKGSDRKSPCESPKITMSSSKSPADSTHSTDADNEELTKNSSDSGPKVPPLKIVIPQQQAPSQPTQQMQPQNPGNSNETQDQQGSSIQRTSIKGGVASRNISSTSSSSLPYVLNASSNSNDSTSNDKQESLVIASTSVASPMTESNKSMNEDGKQVGGKSKEPRVLRSSQRSGKDSKDDRSSNNSSPQLPVSSTPSPAAHNSGDSSSAGTESEGNGQQGMNVTSSTTPATLNVSNQLPSTSNSTISSQQQAQNQQNQPQTSSSSSSQTSVDLHPRKRKIKPSSSKEQQPTSSTSSSANAMVTSSSSAIDTKDSNSKDGSDKTQGSESTHPHDQPFSNCYQMYIDLRKQIDQRHRNLQPIEPRPLKGLEDYLMNRRTYSLHGKPPMEPNLIIPPLLPNQMKETFFEQEKERHKLKMRHIVEKEKLVLSKEQEILRVHCKAAQIQANQTQPFSVCTILKDEEVYNPISPEHEERYNNRSFFKELKDLDDKWDKIKVK